MGKWIQLSHRFATRAEYQETKDSRYSHGLRVTSDRGSILSGKDDGMQLATAELANIPLINGLLEAARELQDLVRMDYKLKAQWEASSYFPYRAEDWEEFMPAQWSKMDQALFRFKEDDGGTC